jgi:hypothetical protein
MSTLRGRHVFGRPAVGASLSKARRGITFAPRLGLGTSLGTNIVVILCELSVWIGTLVAKAEFRVYHGCP